MSAHDQRWGLGPRAGQAFEPEPTCAGIAQWNSGTPQEHITGPWAPNGHPQQPAVELDGGPTAGPEGNIVRCADCGVHAASSGHHR